MKLRRISLAEHLANRPVGQPRKGADAFAVMRAQQAVGQVGGGLVERDDREGADDSRILRKPRKDEIHVRCAHPPLAKSMQRVVVYRGLGLDEALEIVVAPHHALRQPSTMSAYSGWPTKNFAMNGHFRTALRPERRIRPKVPAARRVASPCPANSKGTSVCTSTTRPPSIR